MTAYLIDDEKNSLLLLKSLIHENCQEISNTLLFQDPEELIKAIRVSPPDVLFMDIQLEDTNAFKVLELLTDINFPIIFTTAYNQHALKAIKAGALDYLLKPIDKKELISAVKKVTQSKPKDYSGLQKALENTSSSDRIALPIRNGYEMVDTDTISCLKAEGAYTNLYLSDSKKLVISKNLKYLEDLLDPSLFIRVHHSYIVNRRKIKQIRKDDGGYLLMQDGSTIPVSNSRKKILDYLINKI